MNTYEIREIDALHDGECWTWNTSYNLGIMMTSARDERRAFTRYLQQRHGITFKRNRTRITWDGDVYEITDRKTGEPLFAAIPTA